MLKVYSIAKYMRESGASREVVEKMVADGTLQMVETEGGFHKRIVVEVTPEIDKMQEQIDSVNYKIDRLLKHMGVTA